jgi:hypothetical protein
VKKAGQRLESRLMQAVILEHSPFLGLTLSFWSDGAQPRSSSELPKLQIGVGACWRILHTQWHILHIEILAEHLD